MGKLDRMEQSGDTISIISLRNRRVLIDEVVARLFDVETRAINQQVKRNIERFGEDYAFQMTKAEFERLKSQTVISNPAGRGGRRVPPWVFTREGVIMLSSVLKSDRAVQTLKYVVETFTGLSAQMVGDHGTNFNRLTELRDRIASQLKRVSDAMGDVQVRQDGSTIKAEIATLTETSLKELQAFLSKHQNARDDVLADIQVKLTQAEQNRASALKTLAEAREIEAKAGLIELQLAREAMQAMSEMLDLIDSSNPKPVLDAISTAHPEATLIVLDETQ